MILMSEVGRTIATTDGLHYYDNDGYRVPRTRRTEKAMQLLGRQYLDNYKN